MLKIYFCQFVKKENRGPGSKPLSLGAKNKSPVLPLSPRRTMFLRRFPWEIQPKPQPLVPCIVEPAFFRRDLASQVAGEAMSN